jgi:hypothetical protein
MRRYLLTALMLLSACHHANSGAGDDQVTPEGEVAVRVDSHQFNDATIAIQEGGTWKRLGMARGSGVTSFIVPWRQLSAGGTARLRADPIGGSDPIYTPVLNLRPGAIVVWTLESSLERSNVAVY